MADARVWRCGSIEFRLDRPLVMGILNVTPDSFSDGGRFETEEDAVEAGLLMLGEGASIIDVGGESTRPGADPVSVDEELDRVVPVVRGLAGSGAVVSIDTRHAQTAELCIAAGASIVNDVSGFRADEMIRVVADADCGCVVMHMLGEPRSMQDEPPTYDDVVGEIGAYLSEQAAILEAAGVEPERVALDPGIGFGKTVEHNLEIVRRVGEFADLGHAVVLGASRKSFIGAVLGVEQPDERLGGSLAVAAYAAARGVDVLRVHDVAETMQVVQLLDAIERGFGWAGPGFDDPATLHRAEEAVRSLPDDEPPPVLVSPDDEWVPVVSEHPTDEWGRLGGVSDLLYCEAVLKEKGVPCSFDPVRPGEGTSVYGRRATVRLMVPESWLARARRLLEKDGR